MLVTVAGYFIAEALPDVQATPSYLAAWVAVAFISGTPGLVGIILANRNRTETRAQVAAVRHEVTPNGGSSSFDILHRLAWETHEHTAEILDLATENRRRIEYLEHDLAPRPGGSE